MLTFASFLACFLDLRRWLPRGGLARALYGIAHLSKKKRRSNFARRRIARTGGGVEGVVLYVRTVGVYTHVSFESMETLEERYSSSEEEEEEGEGRTHREEIMEPTSIVEFPRKRSGTPGLGGGPVVVITGGSGRLGKEIAKLVYTHWSGVQEIRLLDVTPPQQSAITGITGYGESCGKPRVSYCPYDVTKVDDLRVCFVKVSVVIHCAAVIENGSIMNKGKMKSVNVEGTRNVIDVCLDCGVQALVFTGSLAQVYTSSIKNPVRFDETMKISRNADLLFPHYGGSKSAAEELILEANKRRGKDRVLLHTCSLRCPPLYGECDTNLILSSLKMAKYACGFSIQMGSKYKTIQSLYTGNAAWAHVVAAQRLVDENSRDTVGGNFYYIGDDSPAWTLGEYHRQFLKPFGFMQIPFIRIPICLLMVVAYLTEFFAILLAFVGIEVKTDLTRASIRWLDYSHSFSWEKARKELQYEPLFDRNAALARSVEYYRQNI